MKHEIAEMWLDALLSGEYAQGRSQLVVRKDDGSKEYCCLGVLCDLALKAGVVVDVDETVLAYANPAVSYDGKKFYLPEAVRTWAGIKTTTGEIAGIDVSSLTNANDMGYSFEDIAELIEEDVEVL